AGFHFPPFTRDSVCRWVCCRRAGGGGPCWVPEELVYLSLPPGVCNRLGPTVSTGLSCGRLGQPVLLRGLQEVVERDALVGGWWGVYPLQEHDAVRVFTELGPALARRLRRPNLRYRFYRIATPLAAH